MARRLADVPPRTPTVPLSVLGKQRIEILQSLGLDDPSTLERRVQALSPEDLDDLRYGVLDLARATIERLLEMDMQPDPPAIVWAEAIPGARLVGQTLLWADHYLVPDRVASVFTRADIRQDSLCEAINTWLVDGPLMVLGLVAPVLDDLAVIITERLVSSRTQKHLQTPDVTAWVESQLLVEGPTAREAIFISVRDDLVRQNHFFLYGRIDHDSLVDSPDAGMTGKVRMLGTYDKDHDYTPWIRQTKQQTVARLVQEVTRETTIAEALGGTYVTNSLFRARLLNRLGRQSPVGATLWAEVPVLVGASSTDLAKLASQEATVHSLRNKVGQTFREVESAEAPDQVRRVRSLVAEIEDEGQRLALEIRSNAKWDRYAAVLSGAAIGLGAIVGGPLGAAGAGLAAAKLMGDSLKRDAAVRRNAAYAFWLANAQRRPPK